MGTKPNVRIGFLSSFPFDNNDDYGCFNFMTIIMMMMIMILISMMVITMIINDDNAGIMMVIITKTS